MPYKPSQCRAFGAKEGRGEKVPADWHEHCRGVKQGKKHGKKKSRGKSR